jgi:hypothetical protein
VSVVVVIVTIPVAIPTMIVGKPPSLAFPITFVEPSAIVVGDHPNCARIWWAGPVTVMPLPMMADRIPIAFHPNEARSGSDWPDSYDTRRRRGADFDANGYLSEEDSSDQEQEREQLLCHRRTLCSVLAISQVPEESIRSQSSYRVNCAYPNVDRAKSHLVARAAILEPGSSTARRRSCPGALHIVGITPIPLKSKRKPPKQSGVSPKTLLHWQEREVRGVAFR